MPRRRALTATGLKFTQGPRFDVHRRGFGSFHEQIAPVTLETGQVLNIPESIIYRALARRKLNFSAQVSEGPINELGGSSIDFVLWDYLIALEYQGPFHAGGEGVERDYWRRFNRQRAGFQVVEVFEHDLPHIDKRIGEIIGMPQVAALMSRR